MPERALGGFHGLCRVVIGRDMRCDQVGSAGILADRQLVTRHADQACRTHCGSPAEAPKDFRDCFDRLDIGLDGQLQPAHAGANAGKVDEGQAAVG
jgi:hypothetical protein